MYSRDLKYILKRQSKYPVVIVSGPREAGKTTLVKNAFRSHKYVSFDDRDTRLFATNDPEEFLTFYRNDSGIVIDEAQRVPTLLQSIQNEVAAQKRPGYFILICSEKLAAEQLACFTDKIGSLTILPLSLREQIEVAEQPQSVDTSILMGGYPTACIGAPAQFYAGYIDFFMEQDIEPKLRATNIAAFQKFVKLCATNVGQLLNLDTLGEECGVSFATARSWVSLLEKHFFLFLLPAHTNAFNKRVTKTPKLYFFDTGIACALLGIQNADVLALHPLRSALFENLIIADLYKQFCNNGLKPPLYYWRDQNGRYEVDCLVETDSSLVAIDIKAATTLAPDAFKKLTTWNALSETSAAHNFLISTGHEIKIKESGTILGWQAASEFVDRLDL